MCELKTELDLLKQKIERLQKRNTYSSALAVVLVGILCLGASKKGGLEVESLRVVGKDGKVKASINSDATGNGCLKLFDSQGRNVVIIGPDPDLSAMAANCVPFSLRFTDRLDRQRLKLGMNAAGIGTLQLLDEKTTPRLVLYESAFGAKIGFADAKGVTLGSVSEGLKGVELVNEDRD